MTKAGMTTPHEATQAPDVKHTPTPWRIDREFNVMAKGGRSVATCGGYSNNMDAERVHVENVANTEFIVTAVNAYDALIQQRAELLKALDSIARMPVAPSEHNGATRAMRIFAENAIANAERGQ